MVKELHYADTALQRDWLVRQIQQISTLLKTGFVESENWRTQNLPQLFSANRNSVKLETKIRIRDMVIGELWIGETVFGKSRFDETRNGNFKRAVRRNYARQRISRKAN